MSYDRNTASRRTVLRSLAAGSLLFPGIVQQLLDLQRKSIDASAQQVDAIAASSRNLLVALASGRPTRLLP